MCWNYFLTNDLYSPFRWYLLEYFELVSEINFFRNYTSGASTWAQEWGNSYQNWEWYNFSKLALKIVVWATGKTEVLDILLTHHFHQPLNLMHLLSQKSEVGSRFMILFDLLSTLIKCHSIHIFSTTTI